MPEKLTAKITKKELQEFQEANEKRLKLNREAKALEERCKQILARAFDVLTESKKQSLKRFGFTLCMIAGTAKVAWKGAFIKECGADAAKALTDEAAKSAPMKAAIVPPNAVPTSTEDVTESDE
jgi:hypothetical protein